MKIKTNIRAGQGGADDTTVDTSSSTSSQKQKGKTTAPVVVYTRCAGY